MEIPMSPFSMSPGQLSGHSPTPPNLVHHSSLWGSESHHHSHPQTHISISPQHSSNSGHSQGHHGHSGGHGLLITAASHHGHNSMGHSHGIHSIDHGYNIYSSGKEFPRNLKFWISKFQNLKFWSLDPPTLWASEFICKFRDAWGRICEFLKWETPCACIWVHFGFECGIRVWDLTVGFECGIWVWDLWWENNIIIRHWSKWDLKWDEGVPVFTSD